MQKIYGAFHAVLLSYRPKVLALSRWLGVFQPLAFTFHGIVPLVFMKCEPNFDADLIGLSLGQIFGAPGESGSTYKAKQRSLAESGVLDDL